METSAETLLGQGDMQIVATALFVVAVLHTFTVKKFQTIANRLPDGSVGENLFRFLGEVEVVFGIWAAVFVAVWCVRFGQDAGVAYMSTVNFTEATFVFVIICMAATKPILKLASILISTLAHFLPLPRELARYLVTLSVGPLLGSLITEPAAMTVTALLIAERFLGEEKSMRFRYVTIGLLFVNISIGGTLTHFAAPPVLMAASSWGWDTTFMLTHFGWRAASSVLIGTILTGLFFRKELRLPPAIKDDLPLPLASEKVPVWIIVTQVVFMIIVVMNAHYMYFFVPVFLLFLGWCSVTQEYQSELKIRESLLVAFFLGGLLTLGKLQDWWLQPLLVQLDNHALFWGALSLTAITDNAALTYLGTLVPELSDAAKYALVAGAVGGGGLTVIANAPNPAGYSILSHFYGKDGISPLYLFLGALPFTLLAAVLFLL
jgi:hypothetical protein